MALPLGPLQNSNSDQRQRETYLPPHREQFITESEENSIELDRLKNTWRELLDGPWNMNRPVEVLSVNRRQNEQEYTRERVSPDTPVTSLNEDGKGIFQVTLRSVQDPRINPNGRRMDAEALPGEGLSTIGIEVDCAIYDPEAYRRHHYHDFNVVPGRPPVTLNPEETIANSGVIGLDGVYRTRTRNIIILERLPIGGREKMVATQIRIYIPQITDWELREIAIRGNAYAEDSRDSITQADELLNELARMYAERIHRSRLGSVISESQPEEVQINNEPHQVIPEALPEEPLPDIQTPVNTPDSQQAPTTPDSMTSATSRVLPDWFLRDEEEFKRRQPAIQSEIRERVLAEIAASRQRNDSLRNNERTQPQAERIDHRLRDNIERRMSDALESQAFDRLHWKDDVDGRRRYETSAVWGTTIQATVSLLEELSGRQLESTQDTSRPGQRGRSMEEMIASLGPRPSEHPMYRIIRRAIENREDFESNRNQAFVLRGIEQSWNFSNEWYVVERIMDPVDGQWKTAVTELKVNPNKPMNEDEYISTARSILEHYPLNNGRIADLRDMREHSRSYIN